MTPAHALRILPHAHLAARPKGVLHVYLGQVTPAGHTPRFARPVCRTRTRQLTISPGGPRLCLRCAARLTSHGRAARPLSRDELRAQYAGVTLEALATELQTARTPEEVDVVGHLSLLLHGHAACKAAGMHAQVGKHRTRVDPDARLAENDRLRVLGENVRNARKDERALIYEQREQRIERIGIRNAKR